MPLYRLFHLSQPTAETAQSTDAYFKAAMGYCSAAVEHGMYREVALIEAPDIHQVFRLSNHIDSDWTRGPAVHAVSRPARSTSIGDIVQDQCGHLQCCAQMGWAPLSDADARRFGELLGGLISTLPPETLLNIAP